MRPWPGCRARTSTGRTSRFGSRTRRSSSSSALRCHDLVTACATAAAQWSSAALEIRRVQPYLYALDPAFVLTKLPELLSGLELTLEIGAIGMAGSLLVGVVGGAFR